MDEFTKALGYVNADYFEKMHNKTKNETIKQVFIIKLHTFANSRKLFEIY